MVKVLSCGQMGAAMWGTTETIKRKVMGLFSGQILACMKVPGRIESRMALDIIQWAKDMKGERENG
jgi:hypothetical protein